jgi:hypothetical protein
MKLNKIGFTGRLLMGIGDAFRSIFGKRAMVESCLYPKQISDHIGWDEFVATGIRRTMVKSSYDKNWYTVDKKALFKADSELATKLDMIDYRVRQICMTNKKKQ